MDSQVKRAKTLALQNRFAEAFELLKEADSNDSYLASYALGTWYLHGRFVQKDLKKAFKYLLKATQGNIKEAFFDLAICYEKGEGTSKDEKKAFQAYVKASNLGEKSAMYEVVRCLYYGIGVGKNRDMSELIFDKVFKLDNHPNSPKERARLKRSSSSKRALVA